jgi:uncharacterized protein with NAD-binding domain and iron-sulfur cluster
MNSKEFTGVTDIEHSYSWVPERFRYLINNPDARLQIRKDFYRKFGKDTHIHDSILKIFFRWLTHREGLGISELEFLEWEIKRNVLNPLHENYPGSPWWRDVNLKFIISSQIAAEIMTGQKVNHEEITNEVGLWIDYIKQRTQRSWYRAHNASIVRAYLDFTDNATKECIYEQAFLNEVLYRLLFAQALIEDDTVFKGIGEFVANPLLPAVDLMVHLPDFYPDHYPLSEQDIQDIMHKGHGIEGVLERAFDDYIIYPHIPKLYKVAAKWLNIPELEYLQSDGKPNYPNLNIKHKTIMDNDQPNTPQKKKKIAILGTGIGALSTAFELTDFPGWQELYDITIYQVGWRAGGKTASSRGVNNRIQERGIHILQGWYWNMFRLVRRSYDERRKKGLDPTQRYQHWKDALVKDDTTLLTTQKDENKNEWDSWPFIFPEDDLIPGDASKIPAKVFVVRILGIVCQLIFGSPYKNRKGPLAFIPQWIFSKLVRSYPIADANPADIPDPKYTDDPLKNAKLCMDDMDDRLEDRSTLSLSRIAFLLLLPLIWLLFLVYTLFRILLWPLLGIWTGLYRFFSATEWILITAKGALQHCYSWKESKLIFGKVNDQDYRVFLKKAGGSKMMIDCGLVKFMYYGSFANLKGNEPGVLAADIAIRIVLDTILYRGSLVWKTRAGTGGTVITPIFQVLKARGVSFRFFHRVKQIHYSNSGFIEKISLAEQVKLAENVQEYQPLKKFNEVYDWPESPLLDQLDPEWAARISEVKVDLESMWANWIDYRDKELLNGQDFDQIVLAIPVNALKDICSEIIDRDHRWAEMVKRVPTTQTFGVQLWISKSWAELGFNGPDWGLRTTDEPNSVNYANLLYSWTDMTRILEEENWPDDNKPRDLAYFCGTMADDPKELPPYSDHSFPETQYKRVFDFSKAWIDQYMGWFFPNGRPADNPFGLDYDLLVNPDSNEKGVPGLELLKKQYFTANIDPSNRYTLAWPGTDKYRFKADETGFDNLFIAGDWTNFGLNVGHLEGTCISGIRAALAVLKTYEE